MLALGRSSALGYVTYASSMTPSEHDYVHRLAFQIITEPDKDVVFELLLELNEFMERTEQHALFLARNAHN